MNIKVNGTSKKTEAAPAAKEVTLKINNGRVKGLTYEMLKACVEDDDICPYMENTGPFGEDQGAMIVSCNAKDANGEMDLGGGDVYRPEDTDDIVVVDREIGQSGLDWTSFADGNVDEDAYIPVGDLPKATTIWHAKGLI